MLAAHNLTLKTRGSDSSIHTSASHKAVSWRNLFRMDTTALVHLRILGLRVWRCGAAQPYLGRLFQSGIGNAEVLAFVTGWFFHVLKSGACVLHTPMHSQQWIPLGNAPFNPSSGTWWIGSAPGWIRCCTRLQQKLPRHTTVCCGRETLYQSVW